MYQIADWQHLILPAMLGMDAGQKVLRVSVQAKKMKETLVQMMRQIELMSFRANRIAV